MGGNIMEALILPERYENLEKVDNIVQGWDNVVLAIRPECRDVKLLDKVKTAINVSLNDSAINYIWNLTIYDLYKKIITYGIEYFASAISWDGTPLKNIDDLREVKDYQIISGAFSLGIIGHEAHFFLQQCREIRNNFSTAHYPMGDIDRYETFNFIKNCVKYVLTFDLPAPGVQIKDIIESLSIEKLENAEQIKLIIEQQSDKIHAALLHNIFTNFIRQECDPILKYNIRIIAPSVWKLVTDEIKSDIGNKFVSLKDIKGKDKANEALEFLKIVDGISFIPEDAKAIIFRKHAKNLIDAHFAMNNFYNEPGYAQDLDMLGNDVPLSALYTYVKAILVSFLGNQYNISRDAQSYNINMINGLSQSGVRILFRILNEDINVVFELLSYRPANRLKELMELIKDKTMLPAQKEEYHFYNSSDTNKLTNHFRNVYDKLHQ